MKPKRGLNLWIFLMLYMQNSWATIIQNNEDDSSLSNQIQENVFLRSKRVVSLATGIFIGSMLSSVVNMAVCKVYNDRLEKEAASGCYYEPKICEVEKIIKNAIKDVKKILEDLKHLDTSLDEVRENYIASSSHFKEWTESLEFISAVMKEVQKIGGRQISYSELNTKEKLENIDEGLKDLLSSQTVDYSQALVVIKKVGVALSTSSNIIGYLADQTLKKAQDRIGLAALEKYTMVQKISKVATAFQAISIVLNTASAFMCTYGIIKSSKDAQQRYKKIVGHRDEILDAMKTLKSAKNEYIQVIGKYEKATEQLTSQSNQVLDLWANHCPNYEEKKATEEDRKNCAEYLDHMKICVTCRSTLREDLVLLRTNWNFVERNAENLMILIRRRNQDLNKFKNVTKEFEKQNIKANEAYDIMTAVYPEPGLKSVIMDAMLDIESWADEMGQWNRWQNSGTCFNECKQQNQRRSCKTQSCIGHDKRTIPCLGAALERCKPEACPKGWDSNYGKCYKIVDVPIDSLSNILTQKVKTLNETQQTLANLQKLDKICYRDCIFQKDCKNVKENNPQLARIGFKTEFSTIVVNGGRKLQHLNTQLVYVDLRLSMEKNTEAIQCRTFHGNSLKAPLDQCQLTKSFAVCEIDLSNENNILYRLMPKRCKTMEKRSELDDACRKEADLAEKRRAYIQV